MFKKMSWGMLLGIFMVLSVSANGQVGAYFGPHLGIQKPKEADKSNYLVGTTLRLKLLSVLGAEASISYRQEEYDANNVTVRNWPVTVTGLLYPFPILYGGVGAGWYNTTFDYDAMYNAIGYSDETKQEMGWHLGAGVELPVSSSVVLFGDVRYVFLDYEFKDLPNAPSGKVDADFHSITAGLLFQL